MEAGRAVMRGFVTPDRTTLIASSHRISAVSEKIEPGDGRASSAKVMEAARVASKRFIAFDMEKIAVEAGSMISASLLGALAGSDALPFIPRATSTRSRAAEGASRPVLLPLPEPSPRHAATDLRHPPAREPGQPTTAQPT